METTYFKMIGQKAPNGKIILVAVVDEDFLNVEQTPNIFEVQSLKMPVTIYTGTYPTIKVNLDTLSEREDLKGLGINGILTQEQWYCSTKKEKDTYGIALPKK